jgi:gluconolactonase
MADVRGCLFLLLAAGVAGQDFNMLSVELISKGHKYLHGAAWNWDPQALLISDTPMNQIWRIVPNQKPQLWREQPTGPAGLAIDEQGRVYVCESRARRVIRLDGKGKEEVLAAEFEGKKLNSPNEIAVRRDGHVYFTDPAYASADQAKELDFYGIYHLPPRGGIEAVARLKTRPNGIALSPDGRRLYVTDSDERTVTRFDLDRSGKAANPQVVLREIPGVPNGLAVDEAGNLYVAASRLFIYSPEGTLIRDIEITGGPPAHCRFGGPDGKLLFVAARQALYGIQMPVRGVVPN